MTRAILPFVVLFILIAESIFADNMPPELFGLLYLPVPHFLFITILFIAIFYDPVYGIYYGMFTGLLYDLVYTDIIGIYMFTFAFFAYITVQLMKFLHASFFVVLLVGLGMVAALEFTVYGMYSLIGITHMLFETFLNNRLYPTLILNALFVLAVFFPFRKWFIDLRKANLQES
ncbi:rod shape-determining protein MreD [Bacillus marinisedimentorum]|uniref:rod shape-determining protein MreD n=1 Tax=Bacillus marinisedimentorum TaxID=1821260 RepID=UPI000872005B|nr:rod shape-determining protein MreD [Bacillus marinisedimentorum]